MPPFPLHATVNVPVPEDEALHMPSLRTPRASQEASSASLARYSMQGTAVEGSRATAASETSRATAVSDNVGNLSELDGFDTFDDVSEHGLLARSGYTEAAHRKIAAASQSQLPGVADDVESTEACHNHVGYTSPVWSLSSMRLRHVMRTGGKAAENLMRELIEEAQTRLDMISSSDKDGSESGASSMLPQSQSANDMVLPSPKLPISPSAIKADSFASTLSPRKTSAERVLVSPRRPSERRDSAKSLVDAFPTKLGGGRPQWSLMAMAERHRAAEARKETDDRTPVERSKDGAPKPRQRATSARAVLNTTKVSPSQVEVLMRMSLELCEQQRRTLQDLVHGGRGASPAEVDDLAARSTSLHAAIAEAMQRLDGA
ncbi:hypothetical protein RI054_03g16600 [Pseudoscourfieldia marina]